MSTHVEHASSTRTAVITGLGAYVPDRVVKNDEVAERLGVTTDWIRDRTGIEQRFILEPTGATRSRLVMRTVGGHPYRYNADCFFQSNIPVTELLLERVLEIADVAADEAGIAVDLYCGVGLFTKPLADRFDRAIGVESDRTTTKFATENTGPCSGWLSTRRWKMFMWP